MGKKRVDVRLRVELLLDDKLAVTKDFLRSYFEDRIKGLKIKSFFTFKQDKDLTLAELDSNLNKLFLLEEAIPKKKTDGSVKPGDPDISEKLMKNTKMLTTQLKSLKITNTAILKAVELIELQAASTHDLLVKLKSESRPSVSVIPTGVS